MPSYATVSVSITPRVRPSRCGHVLNRNRVGKYCAVCIELEFIDERNDDEDKRPAEPDGHN